MSGLLLVYTLLHVAISLAGIGSGFVAIGDMWKARVSRRWTSVFLSTTVLTSVTGFGFPVDRLLPSHAFGVLSLIALGIAIYAWRVRRLSGRWGTVYVAAAIVSQYLNVFVLVVQSFLKIPVLHAMAPTQSELPFAVAQVVTLLGFIALGLVAVRGFSSPRVQGNVSMLDH